jgi:retron-type reverse transcriptase
MPVSSSKLLRRVRGKRNLEAAWRVICENARHSKSEEVRGEIEKFSDDATGNIERLYRSLHRGTFEFPPARGVPIPKGANKRDSSDIRPIVVARTESRIVQRAVLNVLTELPGLECYVNNPYSFGGLRKHDQRRLSAVPAAISAVLSAIGDGGKYVVCADVSRFFTRIPKSSVTAIIAAIVGDADFMDFFGKAIHVELANMAELRRHIDKFPIEDIGVAQGNSLSPLLGNILLHDFDSRMNSGDCRCIRYIDDFIIVAPTVKAAEAKLRQARHILSCFDMELSAEKSSRAPVPITSSFEFLGIELSNGFVRPSRKAQHRLLANVDGELARSIKALSRCQTGEALEKSLSLVATLKRVDGILRGWGKHYRFCNDPSTFEQLDLRIDEAVRSYLGNYSAIRKRAPAEKHRALLGVEELAAIGIQPLTWPKKQSIVASHPA